jgi:hypothetical protein
MVAERTLHRFAAERCGAGGSKVTTPVDDGPPGGELQVDFGHLGLIPAGEGCLLPRLARSDLRFSHAFDDAQLSQ